MNHYCTLFDSNYLTRGLAMYNSLIKTGENFTLYVFVFDELAEQILVKLNLSFVKVISLKEFENEELLKIKVTRTKGEYCWTCTPFIIRHVLERFKVEEVTYIDADLYFFDKPEILLNEFRLTGSDVMLTEHRYTAEYDQTKTSGIYCVQFMTFKNNDNALKILNWWKDRCAEWCFNRFEDGKFGDQKYLDDWQERFKGVYVLQHIGGGVAPWNIQQYKCNIGPKIDNEKVVFYHFHGLKWLKLDKFDLGPYRINNMDIEYIYYPYIEELKSSFNMVRNMYSSTFNKGFEEKKTGFLNKLRVIKSIIVRKRRDVYNVIQR